MNPIADWKDERRAIYECALFLISAFISAAYIYCAEIDRCFLM